MDDESGSVEESVYLILEDALEIYASIIGATAAQAADHLRSRDALEGALARPVHNARYEQADLALQAAVLAHGIAETQPFIDGNKRTALVAMLTFLEINGYFVRATDRELADWIIGLRRGSTPELLARTLRDLRSDVRPDNRPSRGPRPPPKHRALPPCSTEARAGPVPGTRAGELVIAGGQIVTPSGPVVGDLVVRDGRIAEIVPGRGAPRAGSYDARGCLVIPGGVDPHAHALTDIGAASRAAAHGGTTTILTFTLPERDEPPEQAFRRARDELVPDASVDVGIHASYFDPDAVSPPLLEALHSDGVCGLQVFLAFPELGLMFDDGRLYEMLRDATALGLPVQVQCENGAIVDALTRELDASGRTAARFYPRSRPAAVESEAVARTLAIAALAAAPVYLVHLSAAAAVDIARVAQASGAAVTVEACTHHLILDERAYDRPDAHRFIVGPPLRSRADVDALWDAIGDRTVTTVGSDHAHMAAFAPAPGTRFADMPMGLPGIELRVPLVLSEGLRRDIPLGTLVDILAAGPARAFGIHPRKGALVPGADADVVVWDPRAPTAVRGEHLHDGTGHSPYEGERIDGSVRLTLSGGRVLVRDGEFVGEPAGGRFIAPSRRSSG